MTKQATIKSLSEQMHKLKNSVSDQMSTLRYGIGNMLGISHDGKRDTYAIYGYPETLDGTFGFNFMYRYSRRNGVANRITWGIAKTCWRDGFEIYQNSEEGAERIEEDLVLQLQRAGFNRKIEGADILNRIGRMAALYVGVPDGLDPKEPIGKVAGRAENFIDKLYFVAYAYDGVEVSGQVKEPADPRYGLPEFYSLQRVGYTGTEKDTTTKAIVAHWSRVILLNENGLESDIEGMGSLEPVMNRILDLDKATGGASEAYFRNARGKIAYEVDKDYSTSLATNGPAKEAFNEGAQEFTNDWKDHMIAVGSKVKGIDTPHHSPLDTVKVALWEISGYTGIPIRVLTGEGSGQLAGSEDQLSLNQIIKDRQTLVCTTWVQNLLDILTAAGMINLPEGYEVRFPIQEAATTEQKTKNGLTVAQTLQALSQAKSNMGGDSIDLESALTASGLDNVKVETIPDSDIEDAELDA